jgi:hypothetical protein
VASDLLLVLRAEHRHLGMLADRAVRGGRGLQNPTGALSAAARAHVAALGEVLPLLRQRLPATTAGTWADHARRLHGAADEDDHDAMMLAEAIRALVTVEQRDVMPALADGCSLLERRRAGKVYRLRRAATARAVRTTASRRVRSRTELYEVARRAGIEHRSRMTHAELAAAVDAWERSRVSE